jgi:hypothetical protein
MCVIILPSHTPCYGAIVELWQDLGPQLFPLPNSSRLAMVIDSGVDPRHYNIAPQFAAKQSITHSRDGNFPPNGRLGRGECTCLAPSAVTCQTHSSRHRQCVAASSQVLLIMTRPSGLTNAAAGHTMQHARHGIHLWRTQGLVDSASMALHGCLNGCMVGGSRCSETWSRSYMCVGGARRSTSANGSAAL